MNKEKNPGSKAEDLINRYVYAAGRLLPMKNRKEIEAEINGDDIEIIKSPDSSLEGHLLGTVSLNYKLFKLWGK